MFYIVGLGNPGEKYKNTRHNAGRMILNRIVEVYGLPQPVESAKHSGRISKGVISGEDVFLLLPDTYMNLSGTATRKLVSKDEADHLIVIYDDIDLPLGEFKLSFGRGSGGHNGLESIIKELGTKDFIRLRVGIAPKSIFGKTIRPEGEKLSKYVLGLFTRREMSKLEGLVQEVGQVLERIVKDGYQTAMNRFN